jgi:hypothetical protein
MNLTNFIISLMHNFYSKFKKLKYKSIFFIYSKPNILPIATKFSTFSVLNKLFAAS